jgi:cell division septation protein DedD
VLRPHLSVAGRARWFNRETGEYVALAGATVEIRPLRQQSVTDASGRYTFRNLPAGDYTVVAKHDGREHALAVAPVAGSPPAGGVFTIEVAESASVRHARAMVDELKDAGHAAYLEPSASGSSRTYRVRVGRYASLADANQSARTLERALGWRVAVTPDLP